MEYNFVTMMKQCFSLAAVVIILFLCGNAARKDNTAGNKKISEKPPVENNDTLKWIDDFRAFRDAVYHNEQEKVKGFTELPIVSESNDIWYIAYGGDDKMEAALPNGGKPFTGDDFDK